jgi:hypothetical protein
VLGRRLSGLLAVVMLALYALAPAVAAAGEDDEEGTLQFFSVKASHGYQMLVGASARRDDGRGNVNVILVNRQRHRVAQYRSEAFVTDTRLKVSFGALGRMDLTLSPSGKEGQYRAHAPCNGTTESYEEGTYRGRLRFRGEEGFARASASRIVVNPQPLVDLLCSNEIEVETEDLEPGTVGAGLEVGLGMRSRGEPGFRVVKNGPGGRAAINASVFEERHGIVIVRAVQFVVGATAFSYDAPLSTATVEPPAPFSGSATYRRGVALAKRWTGDLTVDLPGRANVPLTGANFKAKLFPATWSIEPPEFH